MVSGANELFGREILKAQSAKIPNEAQTDTVIFHAHQKISRLQRIPKTLKSLYILQPHAMITHLHKLLQSRSLIALGFQLVNQRKAYIVHGQRLQLFVSWLAESLSVEFRREACIGTKRKMSRAITILKPAVEVESAGVAL